MKMHIFMRLLLTLYILVVLFISGVVLACAWGIIDIVHPYYWVSLLQDSLAVRIITTIVAIAVIFISIALMFSGAKKRPPAAAVITETGIGTISVSLSAIEEMAIRHISTNAAVRSVKASVGVRDAKINISARLSVSEGVNIPEILQTLQAGVKEHVELLAGIEVNKVLLLVEKTSQVVKARVE